MSIGVIELRNYLLKPGAREHFIDYYEAVLVDLQEAFNMTILAQFRLIGEPDRFVFMRGFENMQARLQSESYFYEGPVWAKFGPVPNDMILEYHNVHLLRPLDGAGALTCGRSTRDVASELAAGTISTQTGVIGVDIYKALPGQREALVERMQTEIIPAYDHIAIQVRGLFSGEMGKNEFTRHPAIQDENEVVMVTAYESLDACREKRNRVGAQVDAAFKGLVAAPPHGMLLSPTLRSVVRYLPG